MWVHVLGMYIPHHVMIVSDVSAGLAVRVLGKVSVRGVGSGVGTWLNMSDMDRPNIPTCGPTHDG